MVKFKLIEEGREISFPALSRIPCKDETVVLSVPPSLIPTAYKVRKVVTIIEDYMGSEAPTESWEIELL